MFNEWPSELPDVCDIIVIGGAMVGGTLAVALAQQGFRVALVDSRPIDKTTTQPVDPIDRRTTAVAAATASILGAWGIWPEIEPNSCPIASVHVSQRGQFGALRMNARELEVAALGYVVDNALYNTTVASRFDAESRLGVAAPAEVTKFSQSADSVCVELKVNGAAKVISARLLIAADGVDSAIRSRVGIGFTETDYQQYALIASVESELPNNYVAYERFTPSGPLALLPVSSHFNSAIYTCDSSQVEQFKSVDRSDQPALFCQLLQTQFGHRLGELKRCSQPDIYPLVLRSAKQAYAGRVLLLGNALRTLHPVAGQGFNLAIRDMGKLLELLSDAKTDPGDEAVLKTFAAARERDQSVTVGATDLLARLFRGESKTLSHFRGLGLLGLDSLPPLKRAVARLAMGYGARLPDLDY